MFTSPLDMRVLKDGKYQLLAPLVFIYRKTKIIVHEDFQWDLASIPQSLWSILGCPMDFAMESALHDALYNSGVVSREQADLYWYLALRSSGEYKEAVGKAMAKVLHTGVHIGGGPHYMDGDATYAKTFITIEEI